MLKLTVAFTLFAVCWGNSAQTNRPLLNARVAGQVAPPTRKYHFEVDIQHNGSHVCTGVVLGKYDVLTVANCIHELDIQHLAVIDGNGVKHEVAMTQIHPLFVAFNMEYDVALLKVKRPFQFGKNFDKVEIPQPGDHLSPGDSAVVSGWIKDTDGTNDILMAANVVIISNDECNQTYGTHHVVGDSMLCSGSVSNDETPLGCFAEPGAPLVVNDKLYGIASWGDACIPDSPNHVIYTDVSKLDYFLRKNMFIYEYAISKVCAALELVISLLPMIPLVPAWVVTALNLLLKLIC